MIYVVSGLPRSGTSLMMMMLEAGGMEVVVDNIRKPDEDNPKGYYEFEKVKKLKEDTSWLPQTEGKVFKMVSMLLYHLPSDFNYKVVFMERNMKEILASQNRMLERRGHDRTNVSDREMASIYKNHLSEIKQWLTKQDYIDVLYINYNELIDNAQKNTETINGFVGGILNVNRMSRVIDKSLYRERT